MSKASIRSRVLAEKAAHGGPQAEDWDQSVTSEKRKLTTEDRVAARLAQEVMKDNPKFKGIHSNASVRKMLEAEAKKQLIDGGGYQGPVIATIKEKEKREGNDASNLPYLHKNPAI